MEDFEISGINAETLLDYHAELMNQVANGRLAKRTAVEKQQVAKQFIRFIWGQGVIELPRNIDSNELTIRKTTKRIKTMSIDDVKELIDAASHRSKLYVLLMANCGMYQSDIAHLRHDEIDLKAGTITRKRSKTGDQSENVPMVTYKLWPTTFELLKQHLSSHDELALTNANGDRLLVETIRPDGKVSKTDNIRSALCRTYKKLDWKYGDNPPMRIRKTGSTMLASNRDYATFATLYLGHAPSTIAERHYVNYDQQRFNEAIGWLGTELGIKTGQKATKNSKRKRN
jgi:integrase